VSRGFRGAVGFLTVAGGATTPTPSALAWFPVVGAATGAAVGGVWWLAGRVWPVSVAAALAVAADLALTGLLHVDGLCDSADGLLAPMDRARRLEVMAAPDVGAFGVAVCAIVLLLRWVALASLRPSVLLIAALWAVSRTAMGAVARWVPYARPGGLAESFRGAGRGALASWLPLVAGILGALALAVAWKAVAGSVSVVAAVAATSLVVTLAWRRLGGFTGDVLGAAGVVGETVGLVVACAKW
jgi:adenosylcobinamide-GDP ribazoletransferase